MLLDLDKEEYQLLAELLKRRLDEIGVEEHRTKAWHYKTLLRDEHVILERLRGKFENLGLEPAAVAPK